MSDPDSTSDGGVESHTLALTDKQGARADDGDVELEADESEDREVDVFVSYRLNPDAGKAKAFRALLRKTIDPVPNVFVSGDGGLVPSNVALKAQLLTAFHQAKAVVAIITPDSKTREWVIYEAGAAWGCEKLYAPLLVGVEPDAIGSTIVDFVCTKAKEQDEVRRLLEQIAARIKARVKPRFGTSFAPFARHLATGGQQASLSIPVDEGDYHARAESAWTRGEKEDAENLWAEGCREAGVDTDAFARIRLQRLVTLTDDGEEFEQLLAVETPFVRSSPETSLWRGIMADHAHIRVERHRESFQRADIPSEGRAMAREWLAGSLFNVGRSEEASELLLEAISSNEPAATRSDAVALLCKNRPDFSSLSTLMLRLTAYKDTNRTSVRDLAGLAVESSWHMLAMCFAATYDRLDDDSSSKNTVGRAALGAGFPSVAFEAFSRAAEKGASVARANLAIVHANHAVPAAGLASLLQHDGPFDAEDPAFPHRVRADMEKMVADEQKRARALIGKGRRLLAMLLDLVSRAWSATGEQMAQGYVSTLEPKRRLTLVALHPFPNLFEVRADNTLLGLASGMPNGEMIAVTFNLQSTDDARRVVLEASPDTPSAETLTLGS